MYNFLEVTNESTDRKYTLYFSKETFGDSVNHIAEYIFSFIILFFLTLRLLMSYIYMEHLFLMFLDHTQRRSTVGRTPLDE